MALPRNTARSWMGTLDPNRLFDRDSTDYELYEEDDAFVLSAEMPGFDSEEITVSWNDGILNLAAEHEDERRGERRTYHRRFRFPKAIDEESISAEYTNGILEVRLPIRTGRVTGTEIEVQG